MAKDGTDRGRPRRVALIENDDGTFIIQHDGGCDVVLLDEDTQSSRVLTVRPQVILRVKDGKLVGYEAPPKVKVETVKAVKSVKEG